jgi:RES domain-containing protein
VRLWRVCRAPYADLSGEGARLHGGRWNRPGLPAVYLAEHPALALLELRVNLDLPPELIPDDYVMMEVEAGLEPEDAAISPHEPPDRVAEWGTRWLSEGRAPLLRVASVLVPAAFNLILNPRHPDAARARILGTRPFGIDGRLLRAPG